jgi:hypothetical protein
VGDDRFERRQPFDLERLCRRIERNDLVELTERDAPLGAPARLVAKQIRDRRFG